MSANSTRWRRWAVALVRHAASIMPSARSPWAAAMRRELDYIGDDGAALRWALGCVAASYRLRLMQRPRWSATFALRQVAAGGALILLIGIALEDRAGGQTAPPRPVVDEHACDRPDAPTDVRPKNTAARRDGANTEARRAPSECTDPLSKTSETPSSR